MVLKKKDINKGVMDGYATRRLMEDSPARKGERIRPATVNKERMAINSALNRAEAHSKLKKLKSDEVVQNIILFDI